jgi:hypothetical protein
MASIHISCAICDDSLDSVVVEGGGVAVGGPFRDGGCPVRATAGRCGGGGSRPRRCGRRDRCR